MSDLSRTQTSPGKTWLKRLAVKVATLVILGVVFGIGYDWAAPRFYGAERTNGFWLGVLHGGLMPVALPSLLMGKDVPIYATSATGRPYKLGYIAGINLCGLIFFGMAFRAPRPSAAPVVSRSTRLPAGDNLRSSTGLPRSDS